MRFEKLAEQLLSLAGMSVEEAKRILNVGDHFDAQTLKNIRRQLQKALHPDLHGVESTEQSKAVNEAYDILLKEIEKQVIRDEASKKLQEVSRKYKKIKDFVSKYEAQGIVAPETAVSLIKLVDDFYLDADKIEWDLDPKSVESLLQKLNDGYLRLLKYFSSDLR